MKWLVNVLRSRFFLVGIGFLLLIGCVLLLGAWLEWSMTVRLLGVIGVLFVCVVVLVVGFMRANKAAGAIEQSIKMQAQLQKQQTRPDRQSEIEALQRELERAIEMLKQSKLGRRGPRGRAALYALPWYMFIGPPAAGKTTAITNSGLKFPIGTNRIRGVGGTRNCDWFFSDQAILLDTAGRYMTEYEDSEEWMAFLDTLKKHRKERPINGVIVGISLADLADVTVDEVDWHASNIRLRIDELIRHLGVRFPVYVLFTKCDLLQGFVEFFGELTRSEREQIWGSTLDGKQTEADVSRAFEDEFDRLCETLSNLRSAHLMRSMKREERRRVYVFPLEFAAMRDRLSLFVGRLFQPNPYQESPIFRGFYFTSGTQEGVPIDRVIQAIAAQANLPVVTDASGPDPEMEAKSYFIKDVFTEVIIPDQYMVAQTSRTQRRHRFLQAGVGVAAVLLLVLFGLAMSQAFVRSTMSLSRVQEAAEAAAPVNWSTGAAMASLAHMEQLRGEIETLEQREANPPWLQLGLYRGGTVLEPARRLYLDRAQAFVAEHPYPLLLRRLQAPSPEARVQGEAREVLYEDLKAYLLLTSEHARLEEESHRQELRSHLLQLTQERTPALASEETAAALEKQIDTFVEGLRRGQVAPFEPDPVLVSQVRRVIFQAPSVANLYTTIRERAAGELPAFTLADAVPAHYMSHFSTQPEVPGFFTRTGWESYVKEAIARESEDPERTEWVMGYSTEDLPAAMRDQEAVARELEALYFNEYAARWEQFLRNVELRSAGDLRAAAQQLDALGSQYDSPILYVLAHATEQTRFRNEGLENLQDRVEERVDRAAEAQVRNRTGVVGAVTGREKEEELHPVERRFTALHALNANAATSGGAAPGLYKAIEGLKRVAEVLSGLANNGNAQAADYAVQVLEQNGGPLQAELQSIQSALGRFDDDVRRDLFERPVRDAWRLVLRSAQAHLNDQWRSQVYDPFRARLADVYPFSASTQGASLADVESYFHPQSGAVVTFMNEEMKAFLGRDGAPRRWEGQGIAVSAATRQAMAQAERIAGGLFSGGTMRLDLELQPDLPEREGDVPAADAVYISIHGKDDTYRMGSYRPWTAFSWPGGAGASLTLSTRQGDAPVARYEGDWALFRLLQQAQIQRRSGSEYEVRWPHAYEGQGRIIVRYNLRSRSAPGLFDDPRGFFTYQVPETLN